MKSQGLPMTTIAIIVIAIIALVVIMLYFFGGFTQGKEGTHVLLNISSNKTKESQCLSAQFGGCPWNKPYCCPDTGECMSDCSSCPAGEDTDNDKVCG
ncbi:MAG: hypothetical protein J7K73_03715 [Nanoarchaeota archaeon]|nr:hypothetical protein [Nanoarchaeota archaeon]